MVRIKVTGKMPQHSSLLSKFQFSSSPIKNYYYGTPYHYDLHEPFAFGADPNFAITFEATHGFIIPMSSNGTILGAIYHSSLPAWGVMGNQLIGALIRNGIEIHNGTNPFDSFEHTVYYAIRVPSTLQDPSTGQPLRESLAYSNPLIPELSQSSSLPTEYSMITVESPPSAFVMAVKRGTFSPKNIYIRVYQPLNKPTTVVLDLDPKILAGNKAVSIVSSMERALKIPDSPVTIIGSKISFTALRALTTIEISK